MDHDFDQNARHPLLIVGDDSAVSKLRTYVRASGGPISAAPLQEAETAAAARKCLRDEEYPANVMLLCMPHADVEWMDLLKEIETFKLNCAVVILTDDRTAILSARELGYAFFLPYEDLSANMLTETIQTAQEHHYLSQTNKELSVLYKEAERRFQDVADQFADWLWEIDDKMNILFSSSRKRPAQGAEVGGKFTTCFLPEEKVRIEDDFAQLARNPKPFHDQDYWSFDAYGTRMCWSLSGVPVKDEEGNVKGFRGIARDISNEKASTDKLYYLANNDMVTGVYNRSRFFDELARQIRQAERDDREGILVLIDVDRFAYINEAHGHDVGDKLLVHMAQVIQDNLRSGDVAARVAGDEFALILPDVPEADVEYRVNRILEAFASRPMPIEGATLSYNVSVGVTRYPFHANNADLLFSRTSQVLGGAKDKGRNRIEVFSDTTEADANKAESLEWLDFISKCLSEEEDKVVLHYQPIVPLDNRGYKEFYEVLVRMIDPDGNIISPMKFIEAAENFGMVTKIDRIVATRSIEMLKKWHKQGRQVHLSINLSAKTFDDDAFLKDISQLLAESGLPEKTVIFEITETSLLRDLARVREFMARMKEAGAGFALDDCGVGYSSFNYIRHLDLDFIKIDGSFIRNLHISDDDDAFVQALHDVARRKKINTVAEMVEHNETVSKLQKMGIEYGQGFYFATPKPDLPDDDNSIH